MEAEYEIDYRRAPNSFEAEFERICREYDRHNWDMLKMRGVKIPQRKPTKIFFVLMYFVERVQEVVTKLELTEYLSQYFDDVKDVQDARHLSKQKGFYILSGQRGEGNLGRGEYKLLSLTEPYTGYTSNRRTAIAASSFAEMKKKYDDRCATCGDEEGTPGRYFPDSLVKLERGHMDPTKDLTLDNCIPQCSECNKQYKDKFIFDSRGRVVDKNYASDFWK